MRDVVYLPGVDPDAPPHRTPEEIDDVLVRALGRKALSIAEASEILVHNGLPEADVSTHIAEFVRRGYLNDALLAEDLAERFITRKGLGKSHVERQLRDRKIDPTAIAGALESLDLEEERARALAWAERRVTSLHSLDRAVAERRLMGFLVRRGFSPAVASSVCGEVLAGRSRVRFE